MTLKPHQAFIDPATNKVTTLRQIRSQFPQISIGPKTSAEVITELTGFLFVEPTPMPTNLSSTETASKGSPEEYEPGKWRETWTITEKAPIPSPYESITKTQALIAISDASEGLVSGLNEVVEPPEGEDLETFEQPIPGTPLFPNLATNVQFWIKSQERTLKEMAFIESPVWKRSDAYINAIGTQEGLTQEHLDVLFAYGSSQ